MRIRSSVNFGEQLEQVIFAGWKINKTPEFYIFALNILPIFFFGGTYTYGCPHFFLGQATVDSRQSLWRVGGGGLVLTDLWYDNVI